MRDIRTNKQANPSHIVGMTVQHSGHMTCATWFDTFDTCISMRSTDTSGRWEKEMGIVVDDMPHASKSSGYCPLLPTPAKT